MSFQRKQRELLAGLELESWNDGYGTKQAFSKSNENISPNGTNNFDTVLYTLTERRTCTSKCLLHIELWMCIHWCQSASWWSFVQLLEQKVHLFIQSVIKHSRPYHTLLMAFSFGRHLNIHPCPERQVQPRHSIQHALRFLSHDAKSVHSSNFNCKP